MRRRGRGLRGTGRVFSSTRCSSRSSAITDIRTLAQKMLPMAAAIRHSVWWAISGDGSADHQLHDHQHHQLGDQPVDPRRTASLRGIGCRRPGGFLRADGRPRLRLGLRFGDLVGRRLGLVGLLKLGRRILLDRGHRQGPGGSVGVGALQMHIPLGDPARLARITPVEGAGGGLLGECQGVPNRAQITCGLDRDIRLLKRYERITDVAERKLPLGLGAQRSGLVSQNPPPHSLPAYSVF